MVNHTDVYKQAAQDFIRFSGQRAYAALEKAIGRAENCLQVARTTVYDREKADSIDSFVEFFSKGLPEVMYYAPISSHNWIVENYGPTFTFGITDPHPQMGFIFQSRPTVLTPTQVELDIQSRDAATDILLETYETALQRQLITPPRGFQLQFGSYADGSRVVQPKIHKLIQVTIQI
jgi:hypothetical protein